MLCFIWVSDLEVTYLDSMNHHRYREFREASESSTECSTTKGQNMLPHYCKSGVGSWCSRLHSSNNLE